MNFHPGEGLNSGIIDKLIFPFLNIIFVFEDIGSHNSEVGASQMTYTWENEAIL